MAILTELVIDRFKICGWAYSESWVQYTAITKVINEHRKANSMFLKRASTIERLVRKMAQKGIFNSNRKGEFQANLQHPVWEFLGGERHGKTARCNSFNTS